MTEKRGRCEGDDEVKPPVGVTAMYGEQTRERQKYLEVHWVKAWQKILA